MRIISGNAKGLKLKTLKGMDTRPTSDRVKEAIFSMISPYIFDAKVLDLFSGTGNLAIEAISRGGSTAYAVEKNSKCIDIIKENINKANFDERINILNKDALRAIKDLKDIKFDIIFMDPPYLKDLIKPSLKEIALHNILSDNGIIVIEHDIKDILEKTIDSFTTIKKKKYGNTIITIFEKETKHVNSNISREF